MNKEIKDKKRFSIFRVLMALIIISLMIFVILQIITYRETKEVQEEIQSKLSNANSLLIVPTKTSKLILKLYYDDNAQNAFKNDFKNLTVINDKNDIDSITKSIVLSKKYKGESCQCFGSHYLAFYKNENLLGIIAIKHAESMVFYNNNDKYMCHYYINQSAMNSIAITLNKYKIKLD